MPSLLIVTIRHFAITIRYARHAISLRGHAIFTITLIATLFIDTIMADLRLHYLDITHYLRDIYVDLPTPLRRAAAATLR